MPCKCSGFLQDQAPQIIYHYDYYVHKTIQSQAYKLNPNKNTTWEILQQARKWRVHIYIKTPSQGLTYLQVLGIVVDKVATDLSVEGTPSDKEEDADQHDQPGEEERNAHTPETHRYHDC